jgi:hypothetical protein
MRKVKMGNGGRARRAEVDGQRSPRGRPWGNSQRRVDPGGSLNGAYVAVAHPRSLARMQTSIPDIARAVRHAPQTPHPKHLGCAS